MAATPIRSPISAESDSPITLDMGESTARRWSEVTIRVFDASGDAVTTATGTITAQAIKSGTDKPEDFNTTINLATDDWSWLPELSTVRQFVFTVSGLNAGYTLQFTVNNWM